ncbi:hypothetical protein Q9L42_014140 [Methylomarinum sp. Ch1-1]|uniref:Transposase n=1 Tax=Methylomarinum roseum TaxID=3067653 RepID=A0AAU7NQD7_9GAMM
MIAEQKETAKIKGQVAPFQSKLTQAAELLIAVAGHFASTPMLAVTDSWFGNQGYGSRCAKR